MADPLGLKVLVIEDDLATQDTLKRNLERLGCTAAASDNAQDGLAKLGASRFDAVFVALCVRNGGGRPVARWVRDHCPETRCFLVTSWKGDLEPSLLLRDGIIDVIHKPLSLAEIRAKLARQAPGSRQK